MTLLGLKGDYNNFRAVAICPENTYLQSYKDRQPKIVTFGDLQMTPYVPT